MSFEQNPQGDNPPSSVFILTERSLFHRKCRARSCEIKNPALPSRSMRSEAQDSGSPAFANAKAGVHIIQIIWSLKEGSTIFGYKRRAHRAKPYDVIRNRTCLPALCSASLRHHKSVLSHNRSPGSAMSGSCPHSTRLRPLPQNRTLCELPLLCFRRCADT